MGDRSTEHATFSIERVYPALPKRVYHAWTNPKMKARWYGPTDQKDALLLDYRIGGRETFTGEVPNGLIFSYEAIFHEIVPDHRIVYSYTMDIDKVRISASLVTVEITASGDESARLLFTEQGVYLDGADTPADREQGTRVELEALATALSDNSQQQ
jgi:uncharacterized protein YndB with AHSA1/START domain